MFRFIKRRSPGKDAFPGTRATIMVANDRCPQNHPCPAVRICPHGALSQEGFSAPRVHAARCTGCGRCVRFCPQSALVIKKRETAHATV